MELTGSSTEVTFRPEQNWGVVDTTVESIILRGVTSESLGSSTESIDSLELNKSRAPSYTADGLKSHGGSIEFELNKSILKFLGMALGKITTVHDDVADNYKHTISTDKPKSFTLEKNHDDDIFYLFSGCYIDNFSISMEPGATVKSTVNIISKSFGYSEDSIVTAPLTRKAFRFADSIRMKMYLNNVEVKYNSFSVTVSNNTETVTGLGGDSLTSAGAGLLTIEGNFALNVKANETTFLDKISSGAEDKLRIVLGTDNEDFEFSIFMDRIKYFGDVVPKGAGPGLINLDASFKALLDPVSDSVFRIETITDTEEL